MLILGREWNESRAISHRIVSKTALGLDDLGSCERDVPEHLRQVLKQVVVSSSAAPSTS